jgi:MFS family permease
MNQPEANVRLPADARLAPVLATVTSVQAAATLAVLAMATLAPNAAASLGLGAELVGYQVSLTYLAAAATSLVAGVVVRRWGAGTASSAAMCLTFFGGIGIASGNLPTMILATLLIGVGYGLTNPAASHLLFRYTPSSRRNLVFSIKQTGVPIGGVLAGLVLPVVAEQAGWQAAVLTCSAGAAIVLLLLAPFRRSWDTDRVPGIALRSSVIDALGLVWRSPTLRCLSLTGFCFSAAQLSLIAFIVTFLVKDLGWSLVAAGAVAAAVQFCGALGRIMWGVAADRLGSGLAVLALIGILTSLLATATATLTPETPTWITIAILCFLGASGVGWNGVFLADVARLSLAGDVGSATGGALFFTFAGVVFGPALFSLLFSFVGSYGMTIGILGILPLIGSTLVIWVIRSAPLA